MLNNQDTSKKIKKINKKIETIENEIDVLLKKVGKLKLETQELQAAKDLGDASKKKLTLRDFKKGQLVAAKGLDDASNKKIGIVVSVGKMFVIYQPQDKSEKPVRRVPKNLKIIEEKNSVAGTERNSAEKKQLEAAKDWWFWEDKEDEFLYSDVIDVAACFIEEEAGPHYDKIDQLDEFINEIPKIWRETTNSDEYTFSHATSYTESITEVAIAALRMCGIKSGEDVSKPKSQELLTKCMQEFAVQVKHNWERHEEEMFLQERLGTPYFRSDEC